MAMSENQQSKNATEAEARFKRFHERIDAYKDKLNDPATPQWEKKEMTNKMDAMVTQLDRAIKRESSSEPPPQEPEPTPGTGAQKEPQKEPVGAGVGENKPPQGQPSHVVTPVGGQKLEDKK